MDKATIYVHAVCEFYTIRVKNYFTLITRVVCFARRFKDSFTIIPILVGSLSPEREALYGRLLAPYMADPQTLFIISSDFCHWGQRFRYTYYDRSCGPIHRSIQNLDKMVYITSLAFIQTIDF